MKYSFRLSQKQTPLRSVNVRAIRPASDARLSGFGGHLEEVNEKVLAFRNPSVVLLSGWAAANTQLLCRGTERALQDAPIVVVPDVTVTMTSARFGISCMHLAVLSSILGGDGKDSSPPRLVSPAM